jgi:DNA-binding transcriptional MerR regulator
LGDIKIRIPDKLTFTQRDVEKITRLNPRVLLFWENEFKCFFPRVKNDGQKIYSKKDIEKIFYIKQLFVIERKTKDEVKEFIKTTIKKPDQTTKVVTEKQGGKKNKHSEQTDVSNIIPINVSNSHRVDKVILKNNLERNKKLQTVKDGLKELLTILSKDDRNIT